jgi:hypothetical protein
MLLLLISTHFFLTTILTHVFCLHLTLTIDVRFWSLFSLYFSRIHSKPFGFKFFNISHRFVVLLTAMSDLPHPSRNQLIDPGWQIVYSALEESDDVDTPGASTEQLPESEEQPKAQAQHWNKLPHPPQYCPLNQPPTQITDGQGRYYMSHADYVRWEREEAAFSATSRSNLEHSAPPAGATITDSNHRLQSQTPITDSNHRRPITNGQSQTTDIHLWQPTAATADDEKTGVSSSSHLPAPDSTWEEC